MLSGKQRSYLKSIANNLEPILHIGKNGVTETVLNQADDALEAREIIKVKILNNNELSAKETASQMADTLDAEFVQSIGNKFVLYRESKEKIINIPK